MVLKPFSSPHVHIQSLDSASTPASFAKREVELGTGALVVTDHGSLGACQTVYELAKKNKLQPVLGLEGYFRDDDCPILTAAGVPKRYPKDKNGVEDRTQPGTFADYLKYAHFTTHFMDYKAYLTGVKLLSRAPIERHGSESKPLFDWAAMEELGAANTTVTTGCLIGMVQRHLLDNNDPQMALKYFDRLRSCVRPGNLFVEVFPHVCSHNWVTGVFVTVEDTTQDTPLMDTASPAKTVTLKWYAGKTLRTNEGEVKASDLAKSWLGQRCRHEVLHAVKDNRVWTERTPARILDVKHVEDFLPNECRPWCPNGDVQEGANQFMIELAKREKIPVLVSDDSHYSHPEEKVVQDMRLAQSGNWRFYGSYHRQSSQEAWEYFQARGVALGDFEGWVDNSQEWVTRFKDFKLESRVSLPVKFYESKYAEVGAKNSLDYTLHLVKQHGRMDWKDPSKVARLKQEIQLLYRNGTIDLLPYFMLDEEVCRLYRDAGQLTGPGRGSAAGLSLAYLLGITHVDPQRYGLSVDRFLTLVRVLSGKMPDIDQDMGSRDLLVGSEEQGGWLQERFGDHVAQISADTTLKLRSTVLDCARFTMGQVPPDIQALTKDFLEPPQGLGDAKFALGYEADGVWHKGSAEYDPALMAYITTYPDQWVIVQKALGLGRQKTRHACGFLIANVPIPDMGIPLTEIGGVRCTAFTAPSVEAMGGLKMDFLNVNSLNDIQGAIRSVQERSGVPVPKEGVALKGKWVPALRLVPLPGAAQALEDARLQGVDLVTECPEVLWADIWDLPEDQGVFADVACGRTETVFQFNTPGAQQLLRHFAFKKPDGHYAVDSIEAMAAFTALDRPGPLDAYVRTPSAEECRTCRDGKDQDGKPCTHGRHNMLVEYARRARGADPSPDVLPVFERLFPETHGVMVYQEQLQRLYQEVTGCTGAEAEEFRGNIAKKKKEKIIEAYPGFIEGAAKKVGSREAAEAIWAFINSWAAYGFNKSHAVCYVVMAYACAYLKHYYPLEWWCSVLQNAKKEEVSDKFWKHVKDRILLPDVTNARENFEIVDGKIQSPLSLLHGVGDVAHQELVAGAPYHSIADLLRKAEAKKAETRTVKDADGNDKTVKGRSALGRGIVYKLIVSGAMDNLFPPDWTTLQMLESYEEEVWNLENEIRASRKPKPKKRKVAPDPVSKHKPEYLTLTQYTRYQLRKQLLPAYAEPCLPIMVERHHPSITYNGRRHVYSWSRAAKPLPFADQAAIERVNAAAKLPDGGIRVAVAAYVERAKYINYGEHKEKKALKMNVDVNGTKYEFVRWPDRETGELDERFTTALKDSIVILVLGKFREAKPFSIDDMEVVQPAPGSEPDPEPKTEGDAE